eukprot:gene3129-2111_t
MHNIPKNASQLQIWYTQNQLHVILTESYPQSPPNSSATQTSKFLLQHYTLQHTQHHGLTTVNPQNCGLKIPHRNLQTTAQHPPQKQLSAKRTNTQNSKSNFKGCPGTLKRKTGCPTKPNTLAAKPRLQFKPVNSDTAWITQVHIATTLHNNSANSANLNTHPSNRKQKHPPNQFTRSNPRTHTIIHPQETPKYANQALYA